MPGSEDQIKPATASAARRWGRQVWADARQGVIGGIAWLAAGALGVVLLGVRGDTVPAWTLVAAVFAVIAAAAFVAVGAERRAHLLQGALEEARRRAVSQEEAANAARARLTEAAQGDLPAPMSVRAQNWLRRTQTFRESGQGTDAVAQDAEVELVGVLIEEMRSALSHDRTLAVIYDRWVRKPQTHSRRDYLSMLDQLEVVATNAGIEDAQKP